MDDVLRGTTPISSSIWIICFGDVPSLIRPTWQPNAGNNSYCNQDDPLDQWLSHEAKQIVLIDGDSYRLKQAIKKAGPKGKRAKKDKEREGCQVWEVSVALESLTDHPVNMAMTCGDVSVSHLPMAHFFHVSFPEDERVVDTSLGTSQVDVYVYVDNPCVHVNNV